MIILDSNVVSALMYDTPDVKVLHWLDSQDAETLWITTVTIFEIRYGLELMAKGRKRTRLEDSFGFILDTGFRDRVHHLDAEAASEAARLAAKRDREGRPAGLQDTLIAGVALSRHAGIATRNTRHFEDLPISVVNPWTAEGA